MWVLKIQVLLFIISIKGEEPMMNNGKSLKEDHTFIALVTLIKSAIKVVLC